MKMFQSDDHDSLDDYEFNLFKHWLPENNCKCEHERLRLLQEQEEQEK